MRCFVKYLLLWKNPVVKCVVLLSIWRRRHGWEVEATGVVTDSLWVLTVPLLPFTAASVPPCYYDMDSVSSLWDKEKNWQTDQWLALYVLSVMTIISGRKNKQTKYTWKGPAHVKDPYGSGKTFWKYDDVWQLHVKQRQNEWMNKLDLERQTDRQTDRRTETERQTETERTTTKQQKREISLHNRTYNHNPKLAFCFDQPCKHSRFSSTLILLWPTIGSAATSEEPDHIPSSDCRPSLLKYLCHSSYTIASLKRHTRVAFSSVNHRKRSWAWLWRHQRRWVYFRSLYNSTEGHAMCGWECKRQKI